LLTLALSACTPSIPFFSGDDAGVEELLARGQEALQKGDLESAMDIYNEAVDKYPNESHPYHQRAFVHGQLGDIASALRDMDRSIERDPSDLQHIFFRAGIYLNIGNLQGALEDLTRLIELDPSFVEAFGACYDLLCAEPHGGGLG
jgi:tetratricopeptide (TPR) repeat protein